MAGLVSFFINKTVQTFFSDYSVDIIYPLEGNKQDNLLSTYYFPGMLNDFYSI